MWLNKMWFFHTYLHHPLDGDVKFCRELMLCKCSTTPTNMWSIYTIGAVTLLYQTSRCTILAANTMYCINQDPIQYIYWPTNLILAHHNIFLSEYIVRTVGVSSNTSFSTYNLVYRKRWDLSLFNFGAFGDYERDHSKLIHNKIELIKHSYYRTQICRLFTRIMGGLSEVDELL